MSQMSYTTDMTKFFFDLGICRERCLSLLEALVSFKVTRPSFFWGGGVPSYFEALWHPHLYFYRKANT